MIKHVRVFVFLFFCCGFNTVLNAQAVVNITTPSSTVSNAYVRIEGTASGVAKPMWYEVFSQQGVKTDFGAFQQTSNWFFIARHLSSGTNTIHVYGVDAANTQTIATISLTINADGEPGVRPRPHPAEIWWGGLGNNQQLAQYPDQWAMVRKFTDGYFLHASAWGEENNSLMQNVVAQSAPFGTKFIAEIGGGTGTDAGWPQWQHIAWGAGGDGWIMNRYNHNGLVLSEVTHDFQPNWKDFATAFPSFNEAQCVDYMTNQWIEYYNKNYLVFPHLKHALTQSPVWWGWQNYPSLNPSTEVDHFNLNGRVYNFNMDMVMENMSAKTKAIPGHNDWAFFSDFPWYTMVWGEDAVNTTGNTGTEGWVAREKQLAYEQWLHANGNGHTAVCNEDPGVDIMNSNPAEWNRRFASGSINSIHLQQREGHRPNTFLFESWYFGGTPSRGFPDQITPESDDNTFTGVAKNAIKYLKGIKDVQGTLETLVLTNTVAGNTSVFTLKNMGDVACMPALASIETGDEAVVTHWFDGSNTEISTAVKSTEGWVYTPLLNPGESVSIRCELNQTSGNKKVMLEAFWNPQDPTGVVRSRAVWLFGAGAIQAPFAGVSLIPGIIEAENFDNGGEGISYHDVDPQNRTNAYRNEGVDVEASTEGYYNLCYSDNGEWVEYTVNVTQSGNYAIDARVASLAGGSFHLEFNGLNVTGALTAPNTGGWQTWQWVHKEVVLNAGTYVMRFAIDQAGFNTNGFIFTYLGGSSGIISGQTYRLVNRNSLQVLDITGCDIADGARAQQWPWLGGLCQQWTVENTDNGYYKLVAKHSSKALDVINCSSENGANIQQWPFWGGACQQWTIEPTDNGFYRLISKQSGQALEVADASNANGGIVRQWPWNGATCQQWKLEVIANLAHARTATVGNEADEEVSISIFPNPADTQFEVTWPVASNDQHTDIQIIDIHGVLLISEKGITGGRATINTTTLSNGMYVLCIVNDNAQVKKKLIISR